MSPSFYIESTHELVLVKPNGTMEFYSEDGMINESITFPSESAAVIFAQGKGWREVPLAILN